MSLSAPTGRIDIDGLLNEAAWTAAEAHRLVDAVNGMSPEVETSFRAMIDGNNLYLGVRCNEPDMDALRITGQGADTTNVWRDDAVGLVLSTSEDTHYHFSFNPAGAYIDQDRRRQGLQGVLWNSDLEAEAFRGEDHWTLEARIPLKNIRGQRPTPDKPWRFNVGRVRPRSDGWQVSLLSPSGRKTFNNLERTAELIME